MMDTKLPEVHLKDQLLEAKYASLASRARTEQAHQLVGHVYTLVAEGAPQGSRGPYERTTEQMRARR